MLLSAKTMAANHIKELLAEASSLTPESVSTVDFGAGGVSETGKCQVTFQSAGHCTLAFSSLPGDVKADTSTGLESKKLNFYAGGDSGKANFLKVRRMVPGQVP